MHENNHLEPETAVSQELSLADALTLATHLHRAGGLQDAETIYRCILEAAPDNADAMHFLGVLLHQRDRSDESIALIERSIALDPKHADRYNNFGNVLVERGRLKEATEVYRRSLSILPNHSEAWNNLGAVLRAQGQFEESRDAYMRAIEHAPESAHAYNNYGNLLSGLGRVKEAVAYYCKAITLAPRHPDSRRLLGIAHYTLGEVEKAVAVYREWLKEEPDNPVARHMLASCSGTEVPKRASDEFIITTFDSFAGSFDQKLHSLSYQAPQLVANAVQQHSPQKQLVVLDAGCGTGLCGPLIAPYASRLNGVDLSTRMLAVAKSRHVYDELVTGELCSYLIDHPDTFNLVVSADTLVYFGELEDVFVATAKALRPGGMMVFTVEKAEETSAPEGFRINPHGRYSHSRIYVVESLQSAGFAVPTVKEAVLRMESGSPVAGLVVTARLAEGTSSCRRKKEGHPSM